MANTKDHVILATLIKGTTYALVIDRTTSKFFRRGEPVIVTPDEHAQLRETAIDHVSVTYDENDVRSEPRDKFKFEFVTKAEAERRADKKARQSTDPKVRQRAPRETAVA